MPFNGSGVFQRVRNWVADATAGIKIRADYHDAEDDGFAAGLSNCIAKDGQTLITQNIPFNSKRITGLQDPVNPQDAATKKFVEDNSLPPGGGTMTGNITIDNSDPAVVLDADAGGGGYIQGNEDGKTRWLMYLGDNTAEAAGNIGSNFNLHRYANDGTLIGQVLYFDRATGLGTVLADPTAPLGIVTKQYADTTFHPKTAQLFAGIPVNSWGGAYTTVATDAQKALVGSGTMVINTGLFTPGAVITFVAYGANMTITLSAGVLYWNNGGVISTGVRTLSNVGAATAIKLHDNNWVINGSGLT